MTACKHTIDPISIGYWNKENEEGEYYYEVDGQCANCQEQFEESGWGHIDTQEEAIEIINSLII
jgi:elongation factor P hydroxylase